MSFKWVDFGQGDVKGIDENGRVVCYSFTSGTLRLCGPHGDRDYQYENQKAAKADAERLLNKGDSKVKEIMQDIKSFIHDNRNLIYWIALAFVVDHFFFGGKFRERLHGMVDKLIGKAEAKIEASK